jgi:hypothetical protein
MTSNQSIFDLIAEEWRPWFRKFKWLPSAQQQTWSQWFGFLRVLFGEELNAADLALFQQCTGRSDTPTNGFTTAWLCCGRRSGKSRMLAMIAAFLATYRDWKPYMSPGEVPTVMAIAADRKQARTIFRYTRELLKALPVVSIERETQEILELSNGVSVEIMTADFRSVRGYSTVALLLDEVAFWNTSESSNPAAEILRALTPSMATVPGAMMLCASSPYNKSGVLYDAFREHYGKDGDATLFWKAPTRVMNPAVSEAFIKAEYEKDPESASAEFGAEFRADISNFVSAELIDSAIMRGVTVIEPQRGRAYVGFVDVSGGARDAHALSVSMRDDATGIAVSCSACELQTSDTEAVVREFSAILKSYGLDEVWGDGYGKFWVADAFARYGIKFKQVPYDRSMIYLNALPALNSGQVKLLDIQKLRSQLLALERRTIRGSGRDKIDHPNAGHDDLANAVCGALVMASTAERRRTYCWTGSEEINLQLAKIRGVAPPKSDVPVYSVIYKGPDESAAYMPPPIDCRPATNTDWLGDGFSHKQE